MHATPSVGRKKLGPDPRVRLAILAAASNLIREEGVQALSVSAVLARAQLSTRAFYRHFDSKDQLATAVFVEMARVEMMRLRNRMAQYDDPVRAVAAWIEGRLDLAFNDEIRSGLRQMSVEAQSQMFAEPELVGPAYHEVLRPLHEQLARGQASGVFPDIDPATAALSVQGTVWANVERQWATGDRAYADLCRHVLGFCLRGLGVAPVTVTEVIEEIERQGPSGPEGKLSG